MYWIRRFCLSARTLPLALLLLCLVGGLSACQKTPPTESSDYVVGEVEEVISEKQVADTAFGQKKTFRFRVNLPGKSGQISQIIEQEYTAETPPEQWPARGKKYIFFQDQLIDGSRSYTLVEALRAGHPFWLAALAAGVLIIWGRWHGLRPVLIGASMTTSFFLGHFLHLPWLLLGLLTVGATVTTTSLLNFGATRRFSVCLSAGLLSTVLALGLIWFSHVLALADAQTLLNSPLLLQFSAGLSYLLTTVVQVVYSTYRSDPTLKAAELFRKSLQAGRSVLETVTSLYLLILLARFLTLAYGQADTPGLMQLDPLMSELSALFVLLIALALSLPLTVWTSVRMLYRRRV